MHAAVYPHHCRVTARSTLLQRLVERRRDLHPVDAALVLHVGVFEHSLALRDGRAFRHEALLDLLLEVRLWGILRSIAHVELPRARCVHDHGWATPATAASSTLRKKLRRNAAEKHGDCDNGSQSLDGHFATSVSP